MRFGCTLSIVGCLRDPLLPMTRNRSKITIALVGPGFVASHHIDALRGRGNVEMASLAASNLERARAKAAELGVQKAYGRSKS